MNDMLYCIRICDESGDFNLTAEMLAALELDFSSWEDRENPRVIHTVYAQDPESAAANLERLRTAIPEWKPLGVRIGALETFEMKKEDWAETWKKYFHLIPISDRLIIKPSWLECEEKPGRKILEIDPGMAFGTGQHATTFYCLEVIDRLSTDPEVKSLLDAGCGSGILSIAAALLGYSPVDCFDNDPEAVEVCRENFERNRITGVTPTVGDAAVYSGRPEKYDLVCANILAHLLLAFRENIVSWVRPGGYLALAGILTGEFDALSRAFQELGFRELERRTLREWTSGLFRKE